MYFSFFRITRCWHGSSTPKIFFLNSLDWMVWVNAGINRSVADARKESHIIVVGIVLEDRYSVQTASLITTDLICFITSRYWIHYLIHDIYLLIYSLKSWNGRFFERVTLKSLNCRIQLGHPIGEPCLLKYPASGDSFIIIDTSGVHEVGLDYCGCRGVNEATQLLRFRLYPSTTHSPNTAATFRCLRHFQLLSFESKCSAYEYFQTLVRESDNTGLKNVKVHSSFIFCSLLYDIIYLDTL